MLTFPPPNGGRNILQNHEVKHARVFAKAGFMLGSLENVVSVHSLGMAHFMFFGISLIERFWGKSVLDGLLLYSLGEICHHGV